MQLLAVNKHAHKIYKDKRVKRWERYATLLVFFLVFWHDWSTAAMLSGPVREKRSG